MHLRPLSLLPVDLYPERSGMDIRLSSPIITEATSPPLVIRRPTCLFVSDDMAAICRRASRDIISRGGILRL